MVGYFTLDSQTFNLIAYKYYDYYYCGYYYSNQLKYKQGKSTEEYKDEDR